MIPERNATYHTVVNAVRYVYDVDSVDELYEKIKWNKENPFIKKGNSTMNTNDILMMLARNNGSAQLKYSTENTIGTVNVKVDEITRDGLTHITRIHCTVDDPMLAAIKPEKEPSYYNTSVWTQTHPNRVPNINRVIFRHPATIVFWADDTKTVVKVQNNEPFDPEKGLAMAIAKKVYGNKGSYFDNISRHTKGVETAVTGEDNNKKAALSILKAACAEKRITKAEMIEAMEAAIGCLK